LNISITASVCPMGALLSDMAMVQPGAGCSTGASREWT
jgi:hypothetical protein